VGDPAAAPPSPVEAIGAAARAEARLGEAPLAATVVFGDRLPLAVAYAEWLRTAGIARGLLGPREVPRLWERHLLNSAVVESLLPTGADLVDVGSGAGLPGLALAIARPDLLVTLLEPLERRVTFLQEVVDDLGLGNVVVQRGRAEDATPAAWSVAVARAVAPLDRLARWCLPLVPPGGRLLALKGSSARAELATAETALRRAGADRWDVVEAGARLLDTPTTVVCVWRGPAQARPRPRQKERR
jgi:16S rRNA (guanine527-N7)-methyltransferase